MSNFIQGDDKFGFGDYQGEIQGFLLVDPPGLATGAPEPSTWAMLVVGFAGLGFAAYRRTKITD